MNTTDPSFTPNPTLETRTSALAIAALVLGVLGLLLFPFALVALILGIVALVRINGNKSLRGNGFAIAGTSLGVVGLAVSCVSLGILLPALGKARQTARELKDNVQLRGLSQALAVYAANNKGVYPPAGDNWADPLINSGTIPQEALTSPLAVATTSSAPDYLYFAPAKADPSPSTAILMTNPANITRGNGHLAFVSGEVIRLSKPQLEAALADLRAGKQPNIPTRSRD